MPTDVFGPHSHPPDPKKLRLFDVSKSQFVTPTGEPAERKGDDALLFERTGRVEDSSPLVSFLYSLMRDHLPSGVVERLVRESPAGKTTFTNGHAANYAKDVARRLTVSEAHCNHPPAATCCVKGCTLPSNTFLNGKPYCTDHVDGGWEEMKAHMLKRQAVEDQVRVEGGWPKATEIAGPVTLVDRPTPKCSCPGCRRAAAKRLDGEPYCERCADRILTEDRVSDEMSHQPHIPSRVVTELTGRPLSTSERAVAEMQRDGDAEYLKAIGGPTIGFSKETLVHYRCGWCAAWWTLSGGPETGSLYCPKCGKPSQLLEGLPLPVKQF